MKIAFVIASLLLVSTTTGAEASVKDKSSLRGANSVEDKLDASQDQERQLASSYSVATYVQSGSSKIAWRVFENDGSPAVQDQYETTIKFVHVNSYKTGSSPISLMDGVQYCLRAYKGRDESEFGSISGSNDIAVRAGSKTLAYISVDKPGQFVKCFTTPGDACPKGEKREIIAAIGPWDSYTAYEIVGPNKEAWKVSDATGLPGKHDGKRDAFRHCYLSCRLTQEIGSSQAKEVTDIHENCAFHGLPSRSMDQFNNKKGRELGENTSKPSLCESRCMDAVNSGELQLSI